MCVVLFCTVERAWGEVWTVCAFASGAITSIISGYIGMKVAVYANARVALEAQ